jgi:ABC-2 type transport system permease protein
MKQYIAFIRKEFYHVLRDYRTLLVLIGIPIVQIVLFGFALSNEVKNTNLAILDYSSDEHTRGILQEVGSSNYFNITNYIRNEAEADKVLRSGHAKMVVVFQDKFSEDLIHGNKASIQLLTDGIDPNLATTINAYFSAIIQDYQNNYFNREALPYTIEVLTRMEYNPQLRGAFTFVPGVMALVLMLICALMTSVSIVKEKEMGNMEILLASPLRPITIILSKTIPYLVLSLFILTIILLLSVFLLGVPIKGSLLLLLTISFVFIIAALGLGMVISTLTNSQQVAMLISLMGLMLPTVMLSGFMFPIENMPLPLQFVSNFVPAKWFFYGVRDVMIKGLGWQEVYKYILILCVFAIVFLLISFKKFKIRLA